MNNQENKEDTKPLDTDAIETMEDLFGEEITVEEYLERPPEE